MFSPTVPVLLLAVLAVGCNGDTTHVVCQGPLASTDAGRKLGSFVETFNALLAAAGEIDRDMVNVCRAMATDLALPAVAPSPPSDAPGAEAQAACGRVKQEIDRIVRSNLLAGARLAVERTPVVCGLDLDARLRCEQDCDPAAAATRPSRLSCAAGRTYGQCLDTCTGTCTGTCATGCAGACTGVCTGTCAGRCNGSCAGTCTARNADGSCYGSCAGTCAGMCDGDCTGHCSGSCSGTCAASCAGGCLGSCGSWLAPPLCTGPEPATDSPDCRINCDARSRFQAVCAEPLVGVGYGVNATAPQRLQLDRLVAALRGNLARFAKIGHRATTLVDSAATGYAVALQGELETARQIGPDATACVTEAMPLVSDAVARINASVDIDASLTASVSAMGGLPPLP